MSLREQFKTDENKETNGVEIEYGSNDDGTTPTFVVSRMSKQNKSYTKALERALKPFQRQIQLKTMDNEKAGKVLLDVFADTVLKGWKNVKLSDVTGNVQDTGDAPFTKTNVVALMDALPDLYDELNNAATDASNYRDGVIEESAKN